MLLDPEFVKSVASAGPGAVAAIVMVILFLHDRRAERADRVREVAQLFSQLRESTALFTERVKELARDQHENNHAFQAQIKQLTNGLLDVNRDTVHAVKSLDATVHSVQASVQELRSTVAGLQQFLQTHGYKEDR